MYSFVFSEDALLITDRTLPFSYLPSSPIFAIHQPRLILTPTLICLLSIFLSLSLFLFLHSFSSPFHLIVPVFFCPRPFFPFFCPSISFPHFFFHSVPPCSVMYVFSLTAPMPPTRRAHVITSESNEYRPAAKT